MKVGFHLHTRNSVDSNIKPKQLVDEALKIGLDCIIVTDHDSRAGALQCRELAKNTPLQVVVAAEYRSDWGDIICAFIYSDCEEREPRHLVREAHSQGGVTILPHPFSGHDNVEELGALCDAIEVFNARQRPSKNDPALALAHRLHKPQIAGSDAHLISELSNCIMVLDCEPPLDAEKLLSAPRSWVGQHTALANVRRSQAIKARRTKDFKLLVWSLAGIAKQKLKDRSKRERFEGEWAPGSL
jgi:predicted metal-dependent phosphoesterase TrpH